MDMKALEEMGIHIVTEEERNAVLHAQAEHMSLMAQLSKRFSEHPPKEVDVTLIVNISNKERMDFKEEIRYLFPESSLTEEAILLHLVCDLTGYRSSGSDERMMAHEWLDGVNPQSDVISAPEEFDQDTLHEVSYTLPLLDWEKERLETLACQAGLTADQLIECFIRDVAGYRPPGAALGHVALNWLHRNAPNF